MKIEKFSVKSAVKKQSGFPAESKEKRTARMKAFWANAANAVLVALGQLFAWSDGKERIADVLARNGGVVDLPETIEIDGVSFPLAEESKHLSMLTADGKSYTSSFKLWQCPACQSAHGSGTYPSKAIDADGLASNQVYYSPVTKQLFTISDSCYAGTKKSPGYVVAFGAHRRILTPRDWQSKLAKATPAPSKA